MITKIKDQELNNLFKKIEKERGIVCSNFRLPYAKRRVLTRLRANKVESLIDYTAILNKTPDEYQKLIDALTINVSGFFRDQGIYKELEDKLIPRIMKEKKKHNQKVIRVWSAGCATGEEPYSVAMILQKAANRYPNRWLISVYATDVDKKSLTFARNAVYPIERLNEIPQKFHQYTIKTSENTFSIDAIIKTMVKFRNANLFKYEQFRFLDLIFCRNVLIYFNREEQLKLYRNFSKVLNPKGFLIIGKTENIVGTGNKFFQAENARNSIYKIKSQPTVWREAK